MAVIVYRLQDGSKARAQSASQSGQSRNSRSRSGPAEIPVAAAKAVTGNVPVYLDGLGSVSPFYTVTVHTRVDGQLMTVNFQEGQFVTKDQPIAQIDPRPFQVQLEQAEGQMARDQALLSNAKLDLTRYRTLLAQDAIPKQQLDTQISAVAQYEGAIKQDQAAIDSAKLNLTYAHVTAPISGRVGLRQVDPGNIVHASDQNGLVVIAQMQPIAALFTIPEDALPSVLAGLRRGRQLPADAYNRDKSRKISTGRLLTVDNQIDPQTGTARLKAVFDNRDLSLFPDQFVNIRLLVDTLHNQIIIPSASVQRGQEGTFAYVIKPDSTVEARTIALGITEGNQTSIRSGLKTGEFVVVDGADKLQPGSKVRVRQSGAGPNGPNRTGGTQDESADPGTAHATGSGA